MGPTRSFSRLFSVKQPEKLHKMSVVMRRQLLGIKNNRQPTGMSAYFPLGVVQLPYDVFGQSYYPLVQEEASVIAGATGMGKLVSSILAKSHGNTLDIKGIIPFDRLTKDGIDGETMADGILEIYKAAFRDPQRAITNNKGIINATFPFLHALFPSTSVNSTAKLLSTATDSGVNFLTGKKQYGPLVHWRTCTTSNQLIGEISVPIDHNLMVSGNDSYIIKDAVSIFGKSKASDPTEIARAIGSLAILQNLAALRSIYFKGNRAHHMDHHNAGTGSIHRLKLPLDMDGTSEDTLESLIENYVVSVNSPLKEFNIGNNNIVTSGPFNITNHAVLSLLDNAAIHIKTKRPEIIGQIFYRKTLENGLSIEAFISMLNDPDFLTKQHDKIMDADNESADNTLTRLKNRLGHSLIIPSGHDVVQLGTTSVRQNIRLHVGETQGANRANAYAELCRKVMNEKIDSTGWEAKGGILSNYHTDRGPTFNVLIPSETFNSLGLNLSSIIELSRRSLNDTDVANKINLAALNGMIASDLATGQDTRGNIASFLFAANESKDSQIQPFILIEQKKNVVQISSGFPMASARTAVGRVVNALDSVRIARSKMGIPIDGEATGKVNQLDERACLTAIAGGLQKIIELASC